MPPETSKLKANLELNELEEAIVNFVNAETVAGATPEEIRDFYNVYTNNSLIHPRTQGNELTELMVASNKVRTMYGRNWKDFMNGYFEDAISALEFVAEDAKEESESSKL